ncbi:MAG TPA: hypothetical protein VLD39_00540 [Gammaproteobacteria bacterium]|nr:hypothetical protein [Gammaproteobacteria bacterium]
MLALAALRVEAFPPYRSTDADTAGDGNFELRLGLARVQREESTSRRSSPLTRANYGLGPNTEIISELEYSADAHELAEGALGFKWVRRSGARGIGVETLALLPVRDGQSGSGIESQLLVSFVDEHRQLHINVGGFYDSRSRETERGWRASVFVEFPRDGFEPGVELFVKDADGEEARIQAGLGLIKPFRFLELRTSVHIGLSDAAPDVEADLWLAWRWQLGRD